LASTGSGDTGGGVAPKIPNGQADVGEGIAESGLAIPAGPVELPQPASAMIVAGAKTAAR
jgi:hypothetical protein